MNFRLLSLLLISYPRLSSTTSQIHVRSGRENNAAARYWWRGLSVRVTALLFHGFTVTYLFTMHYLVDWWSMAIHLFFNREWLLWCCCFHLQFVVFFFPRIWASWINGEHHLQSLLDQGMHPQTLCFLLANWALMLSLRIYEVLWLNIN
jgi:hypothetical protein